MIEEIILATDMSIHNTLCENFGKKVAGISDGKSEHNKEDVDD